MATPASALAVAPAPGDPRVLNQGKKIGILIVAYNAVTTLTKVLNRIPKDTWDNVGEVAVMDDASQDSTYELALGYKSVSQMEKLEVVRHPLNLGYGGNQKNGYRYFIDKGYDVVVLLHGDGQYAPEILSHLYAPIVAGEADAVFGSRMMNAFGGPLKGGMPLYKYLGNRVLTEFENRSLGLNLTEFHSGYRAYNLHALKEIDFNNMTNDFHFDTEIIIKLHHQGFRIHEVPIPTYYGAEICYVNGMRYAWDVTKAVLRYKRTVQSLEKAPEFAEYWTHYPVKESRYSSHYYLRQWIGSQQQVLDVGCGEGHQAADVQELGNEVTGIDCVESPKRGSSMRQYIRADLGGGLAPLADELEQKKFDKILLMDIIEHLPDPARVLSEIQTTAFGEGADYPVAAECREHHGAVGTAVRAIRVRRPGHPGQYASSILYAEDRAADDRGVRVHDRAASDDGDAGGTGAGYLREEPVNARGECCAARCDVADAGPVRVSVHVSAAAERINRSD